jgi:probable selenium-dependent hydroxylase accessory protein YqeC
VSQSPAELLATFGAERGIVCAIGAGGKKTTMYRLAAAHSGRVAVTATVATPAYPAELDLTLAVAPPESIVDRAGEIADAPRIGLACPHERVDRLAGLPPAAVADIHRQTGRDLTLVKADGARMRWMKVPAPGEPVLPPGTATVIVLTSARCLGEPLTDRVAHRLERVLEVTGGDAGEPVTPALLARLYTAPGGLLTGLDAARIVPTINMVDDEDRLTAARDAARRILGSTPGVSRIILACMKRAENPIVEVIER